MITSIFQLMDFIIKRVRQCCDVNEIYKSFSMNLKPFFFLTCLLPFYTDMLQTVRH